MGITNSKANRRRWTSERMSRERDVFILTELDIYEAVGLESQDRIIQFNNSPITGLDSLIDAMEKTRAGIQAGEVDSADLVFERDRLDQLVLITFKAQ